MLVKINVSVLILVIGFAHPALSAVAEKLWDCQEKAVDLNTFPLVKKNYGARRADNYLPSSQYPEAGSTDLTRGARVTLMAPAAHSGTITAVNFDKRNLFDAEQKGEVDWFHVWPRNAQKDQPVWITLHSQNDVIHAPAMRSVQIYGDQGTVLDTQVLISEQPVRINYVTTSKNHHRLHVFIENRANQHKHVSRLVVNGRDVTPYACMTRKVIRKDGGVQTYFLSMKNPLLPGSAYSVAVEFEDAPPAVGVGRILPEVFVNEAWTKSDEGAYPSANENHVTKLVDAGINTLFIQKGAGHQYGTDEKVIIDTLRDRGMWSFIEHNITHRKFQAYSDRIVARHLGDELDASPNVEETLRWLAQSSRKFWDIEPSIPTFIGGSRHRKNGRFAGVTDIQGMDFYTAACAPHPTKIFHTPPLRGSFDYARVARNNQMPNATWIYTQGFSAAWKSQPQPHEVLVQAASVLAAGSKGILWFQTSIDLGFQKNSEAWKALKTFNRRINSIGDYIRISDMCDAAFSHNKDLLVQALLGDDYLIVIVINMKVTHQPSDVQCALTHYDPWRLGSASGEVVVRIPYDVGVDKIVEVDDSGWKDVSTFKKEVRRVSLPVNLSESHPFQIFLFD